MSAAVAVQYRHLKCIVNAFLMSLRLRLRFMCKKKVAFSAHLEVCSRNLSQEIWGQSCNRNCRRRRLLLLPHSRLKRSKTSVLHFVINIKEIPCPPTVAAKSSPFRRRTYVQMCRHSDTYTHTHPACQNAALQGHINNWVAPQKLPAKCWVGAGAANTGYLLSYANDVGSAFKVLWMASSLSNWISAENFHLGTKPQQLRFKMCSFFKKLIIVS